MIRILALIAMTTAAHADPSRNWGGSSATLSAGPGTPMAYVDFVNRLTVVNEMFMAFTLDLGGFDVEIDVDHGPGDAPDRYTITPPEGFIAVPQIIEVDEGDTGRVAIYRADGVGA